MVQDSMPRVVQNWMPITTQLPAPARLPPRRLVAAAGRSVASFVLDRASVSVGPVALFVQGVPHDERADEAAAVMRARDMTVVVDLGTGGNHAATMWTCDFSAEYVRINAEYRT